MANSKQINFSVIENLKVILKSIKVIIQELGDNKEIQDDKIQEQARQIEAQESGYINSLVCDIRNTNKKPEKKLQQAVTKQEDTKRVSTKTQVRDIDKEKTKGYEIDD